MLLKNIFSFAFLIFAFSYQGHAAPLGGGGNDYLWLKIAYQASFEEGTSYAYIKLPNLSMWKGSNVCTDNDGLVVTVAEMDLELRTNKDDPINAYLGKTTIRGEEKYIGQSCKEGTIWKPATTAELMELHSFRGYVRHRESNFMLYLELDGLKQFFLSNPTAVTGRFCGNTNKCYIFKGIEIFSAN